MSAVDERCKLMRLQSVGLALTMVGENRLVILSCSQPDGLSIDDNQAKAFLCILRPHMHYKTPVCIISHAPPTFRSSFPIDVPVSTNSRRLVRARADRAMRLLLLFGPHRET
jgi:hypothetical protein